MSRLAVKGPQNLLLWTYWGCSSSSEVKNVWSYTSTPPKAFVMCTETILLFFSSLLTKSTWWYGRPATVHSQTKCQTQAEGDLELREVASKGRSHVTTRLLFVWVYNTQLCVVEVRLGASGNKTPLHKSWYHNPNPSPMINDPACHPEVKPWARVPRDAGQFFRIVADEGWTLNWRKQVRIRYYLIKFVHSSTYMGREYTTNIPSRVKYYLFVLSETSFSALL